MTFRIINADVLAGLAGLPDESVHCVVTSPPYWGLRDYGIEGQLGCEPTFEEHVERLVLVFREVRRVLRKDGTLWLNYGDAYASNSWGGGPGSVTLGGGRRNLDACRAARKHRQRLPVGTKPKDLIGMPWRVAFRLQADGWWLRSDIVWHKPSVTPESVKDRPTKSHEYVFLFSRSPRYFFDADAVRTPFAASSIYQTKNGYRGTATKGFGHARAQDASKAKSSIIESIRWRLQHNKSAGANVRTVWTIPSQAFADAHFATFPEALADRCIRAGCPAGGTVLDPFTGSGTTGVVAMRLARTFIGIDLSPKYAKMARRRIVGDAPLFNRGTSE